MRPAVASVPHPHSVDRNGITSNIRWFSESRAIDSKLLDVYIVPMTAVDGEMMNYDSKGRDA